LDRLLVCSSHCSTMPLPMSLEKVSETSRRWVGSQRGNLGPPAFTMSARTLAAQLPPPVRRCSPVFGLIVPSKVGICIEAPPIQSDPTQRTFQRQGRNLGSRSMVTASAYEHRSPFAPDTVSPKGSCSRYGLRHMTSERRMNSGKSHCYRFVRPCRRSSSRWWFARGSD
jgi:hypothetical protein